MTEKHTRQNNAGGSSQGKTYYPKRGGKANVSAKDGDFVLPSHCWCGEQHSQLGDNPQYWTAGIHPWPALIEEPAEPEQFVCHYRAVDICGVFGPFNSREDADAWAIRFQPSGSWTVGPLLTPPSHS